MQNHLPVTARADESAATETTAQETMQETMQEMSDLTLQKMFKPTRPHGIRI